jgi:putative transposase
VLDGRLYRRPLTAPKPLTAAQFRLRALQRRAARQHGPYDAVTQTRRKPSQRWMHTNDRIGRLHARVTAIRSNELHHATTALATRHEVVVEHLNVGGMRRQGGAHKRGLNRALGDAALARIRTQLAYKSGWYGADLIVAPRFFPSTQLCSRCGAKTKLRLRERAYHCRNGCPPIDRDLNAAINLARLCEATAYGGRIGTGTGSRSAASVTAGNGRGANQKTNPTAAMGTAGGDETSTPREAKTGTASSQGEAA